jgi:hypothetical protein
MHKRTVSVLQHGRRQRATRMRSVAKRVLLGQLLVGELLGNRRLASRTNTRAPGAAGLVFGESTS